MKTLVTEVTYIHVLSPPRMNLLQRTELGSCAYYVTRGPSAFCIRSRGQRRGLDCVGVLSLSKLMIAGFFSMWNYWHYFTSLKLSFKIVFKAEKRQSLVSVFGSSSPKCTY